MLMLGGDRQANAALQDSDVGIRRAISAGHPVSA